MTSAQCGHAGEQLISILTDFCNLVLSGRVPHAIRPVFCGANLLALSKKEGGIRPIAVGCTLRRLVAKVAVSLISSQAAAILSPRQLGVGIKYGTEAAAHSMRCYIRNNLDLGHAIIKLDFNNAFNNIHRDVMLSAVHQHMPGLLKFIFTCYADPSILSFGDEIILSEEGAQQGDPLGPLLFCLSIHRLVEKLSSEMNLWYIDDGILGGHLPDLLRDIEVIRSEGPPIGLTLNVSKCELISTDAAVIDSVRQIWPSVAIIDPQEAVILGAPVGGSQATDTILLKKLTEFQRLADRLKHMCTHDGFFLLKNCFSLPKLMYTLRTAPCKDSVIIVQYDEIIRNTLQIILNVSVSDEAWDQCKLPVKRGGLGISSASDIALPAFIASISGSAELALKILPPTLASRAGCNDVDYLKYIGLWQSITNLPLPERALAPEQRQWTKPMQVLAAEAVLSAAPNQTSRARLIAAAAPSSGAFLQAVPMSSVGTRLDDASIRIAVALRLGAPVCTPHQCICGTAVDSSGVHGLSCRRSAGRIARHTAINGLIKAALIAADVPCRLEPRGLSRDDGKRPDGVTTMPWKNGRCLVWDVTCPDTLAASYAANAVTGPGMVASLAERKKRAKYSMLNTALYLFQPIAIETLGAFGIDAWDFILELGHRLRSITRDPRAATFLLQRLSVAMQRGNAACVLGTVANYDSGCDFFG